MRNLKIKAEISMCYKSAKEKKNVNRNTLLEENIENSLSGSEVENKRKMQKVLLSIR